MEPPLYKSQFSKVVINFKYQLEGLDSTGTDSVVKVVKFMVDTGFQFIVEVDKEATLANNKNSPERKPQVYENIFLDTFLIYLLMCRDATNIANFGDPANTQNVRFFIKHWLKDRFNNKLLAKVARLSYIRSGDMAPDSKLRNHNGEEYQLSQSSKIKLLTFGASW